MQSCLKVHEEESRVWRNIIMTAFLPRLQGALRGKNELLWSHSTNLQGSRGIGELLPWKTFVTQVRLEEHHPQQVNTEWKTLVTQVWLEENQPQQVNTAGVVIGRWYRVGEDVVDGVTATGTSWQRWYRDDDDNDDDCWWQPHGWSTGYCVKSMKIETSERVCGAIDCRCWQCCNYSCRRPLCTRTLWSHPPTQCTLDSLQRVCMSVRQCFPFESSRRADNRSPGMSKWRCTITSRV